MPFSSASLRFFFNYAIALLALSCPALATDQTTAQEEARKVHDQGSDDSLKSSYGNALHAVNNFFQLNIPGAITHGLKAYGQYRNSQNMDDLKDKNQKLENSMSSAGHENPSQVSGGNDHYTSPYQRLDRKFLYDGDTGAIAAKMEKLSGISREKMFAMAVNIHERSKRISDPGFLGWALQTFKGTLSKLPDSELKEGLGKAGGLAEKMIRSGEGDKVLAKFRGEQGAPPADSTVAANGFKEDAPNISSSPTEDVPPREEALSPPQKQNSAKEIAHEGNHGLMGMDRISFDPVDGYLSDLMKSANKKEEEISLFQMVRRKIRDLRVRQRI